MDRYLRVLMSLTKYLQPSCGLSQVHSAKLYNKYTSLKHIPVYHNRLAPISARAPEDIFQLFNVDVRIYPII